MDIIVTTECNRKCQGCCYLFNKYKKGEFLDADTIIKEMRMIRPIIEDEGFASIIGGETFLYPDLVKVMKELQEYNIVSCTIFTNGTIYPDYLEELCKVANDKVWIFIGGYGNPEIMQRIQDMCEKYNVHCPVRPDDMDWVEHGDFIDHNEEKITFCDFRYSTLMKGKVFACGRFAQAWNLGLIKLEDMDDNEWVDIYEDTDLKKCRELSSQRFDTFSSTCRYCLRGSKKGVSITQGK